MTLAGVRPDPSRSMSFVVRLIGYGHIHSDCREGSSKEREHIRSRSNLILLPTTCARRWVSKPVGARRFELRGEQPGPGACQDMPHPPRGRRRSQAGCARRRPAAGRARICGSPGIDRPRAVIPNIVQGPRVGRLIRYRYWPASARSTSARTYLVVPLDGSDHCPHRSQRSGWRQAGLPRAGRLCRSSGTGCTGRPGRPNRAPPAHGGRAHQPHRRRVRM
jgi:hypothetical protein